MNQIIEFFEPSLGVTSWLGKVVLLYIASYFIIWIVALILSRVRWFVSEEDAILKVYFGWLIPLTLHTIFFTSFLLFSLLHYKELGISSWFCSAYFLPIFLSGFLGISLSLNIRERIKKRENKRIKGG